MREPVASRAERARHATDRALWSAYSAVYDGLLGFWPYRALLRRVTDEARLDDAGSLLDIGCGTGNLLTLCSHEHPGLRVVGVDASAPMLRRARTKLAADTHRAQLIQADALDYLRGAPTASFDRVTASNVLYTLPDRAAFWRETTRVLVPGGIAVVTTSTRGGSMPIVREHLDHASVFALLRPRLIAVFVIDALISTLARTNHFSFPSEAALAAEARDNGAEVLHIDRAYGGVNVILTARGAATPRSLR